MKQQSTINGENMNTINTINGGSMLNLSDQDIHRIINNLEIKAVVCDDNGSQVEVFQLKEGFLVSVEGGDYAYWTSDRDVAIRLWAEYQEDAFWKEALITLGGVTEPDEYIALHLHDAYKEVAYAV